MMIGDKIKGFGQDIQIGAQKASHSLFHSGLRLITGFFVGLVLSLIIQELTQSGTFVLIFLTLVLGGAIYKALSRMSVLQIMIFDLVCVLIATILRMYIMIAP